MVGIDHLWFDKTKYLPLSANSSGTLSYNGVRFVPAPVEVLIKAGKQVYCSENYESTELKWHTLKRDITKECVGFDNKNNYYMFIVDDGSLTGGGVIQDIYIDGSAYGMSLNQVFYARKSDCQIVKGGVTSPANPLARLIAVFRRAVIA